MSLPGSRSCGRPTSPLTRRTTPCVSCFSPFCAAGSRGTPSNSPACPRRSPPCPSWSCTTESWTCISPSPRPSAVRWTRTGSTTAGSGWPRKSTKFCSTSCAATSASAPGAARPCPCTTGAGCARPVTGRAGKEKNWSGNPAPAYPYPAVKCAGTSAPPSAGPEPAPGCLPPAGYPVPPSYPAGPAAGCPVR